MAGIYIHIPFCKQACSYCDFHFSTNLSRKEDLIHALVQEAKLCSTYLKKEKVETIYIGGGTPSILSSEELNQIFDALTKHYEIASDAEVTLEANPDDLDLTKLKELRATPVNRLSIGVQSFFDEDLQFMNRAHSAQEAFDSIKSAQDVGFENINLDLIFGSQTTTNEMWDKNLSHFFDLKVPHLSAYSLTVEEKTALSNRISKGKIPPVDDEKNHLQYQILQKSIDQNNFQQYEVSNYCLGVNYSKHNKSYWTGKNYLGIGPSAHSFNGNSRQWNIRNNIKYIKALSQGLPFFEKESLSEIDQYHEFLITSLRTKWGINRVQLKSSFSDAIIAQFEKKLTLLNQSKVEITSNLLRIKRPFLFQSDELVRELMID